MPQTHSYAELFSHMRSAQISPWTNNWVEVFDFTPHKKASTGEPNFEIVSDQVMDFIRPVEQAKKLQELAT